MSIGWFYFPLLGEQAREVTVKAQPMLLPLLDGMPRPGRLVNTWSTEPDPAYEVAIECMELAYAFRSTAETVPATVPYLSVERLRGRGNFIFNDNKAHVGLVWAASDWDTSRSLAIEDLAPLAVVPGVVFHSLQQGLRGAEIALSPLPLDALARRTAEVADAAAAMLALDLVITVDTMAAHLAGALGRPVWLILRHEADWRWIRARDRSPWYPTMRIFWQPQAGDWRSVMERVARELCLF